MKKMRPYRKKIQSQRILKRKKKITKAPHLKIQEKIKNKSPKLSSKNGKKKIRKPLPLASNKIRLKRVNPKRLRLHHPLALQHLRANQLAKTRSQSRISQHQRARKELKRNRMKDLNHQSRRKPKILKILKTISVVEEQ